MELSSQNIGTSTNPETKGFDLSAGNIWMYPENYPVREYQYNIVKTALYHNTLVCLPTGLGKTFIAAVVMYNFWRWYPFGKIVFLAPTKPLVAQQINACYEIMGIPSIDTIELTGAVNQKNRELAWLKKRIIFATPQVFHNDLEKSIVPSHLIKCIVVDEAHKALGRHSYCECIKILSTQNQYFRILALSATPGNKIDNVHEVIRNLCISRLELRDENSIDILPYINKRKIDIVLVPLSNELAAFKERYIIIMDRHVKSLIQHNVLRGHTANISKGRIFHLLREFKAKTNKSGNYVQIMKTLNILLTMYHAYELMIRHGLRAFCKFYQNHSDKFWMHNENQLKELLYDIEIFLGPFPNILPNGDISEIPTNLVFGHNKFHKLKELLEHHFRSNNGDQKDTRAIVFVEYRDIVNEVFILLLQSKPIIRPQMFVGQASQKQKQQIKALEDFRSNHVNVLISTSIGEEGLDVGEVDLIICFDVSQHSPIRLVQRMGRTGRKRNGHIIVLVTDGKEHENLKSTLSRRDSLNNKILNTSNIFSSLYQNNPRMIPSQFTPECYKIHITALPKTPNIKGISKKKGVKKKIEASTIKQKENTMQKYASQSLMMKFLTNNKYNNNEEKQNTTCNIFNTLTTQSNKIYNTINPSNVKLLSDDNTGIDFLTLCTVKKSEEEMNRPTLRKMDTTYIPTPKPVKDLFNFVVPDTNMLDLSFLNMNLNNLPTQYENYEDKNILNNDYININDDDNVWCTIRNEENIDNDKIRFEDLLDESSDSDKTTISHLNRKITDIGIYSVNTSKIVTSHTKNDNEVMTDYIKQELSTTVENTYIEPSIFENILNDSFSSTDLEEEDKKAAQQNITSPKFSNAFNKNTGNINITCERADNISHDEQNIDKFNQNLEVAKLVNINEKIKLERSFMDEIQDFDFNSNNNINEFICEFNENKVTSNLKAAESWLSNETTQIKKNLEKSLESSINKKETVIEDSSGWISVNTKFETRIEKKDTRLRIENKSNINYNSVAKSYVTKQDFVSLDDSDEDFVITEDNVKKFDELESSYFCNTSKILKTNSLSWESKNSYFNNNTSKNFETSNSSLYSKSRTVQSRDISMSADSRHFGLSLKRNGALHSNAIELIVSEKPSKYINTKKDDNFLASNISSPKQMSSMDGKTMNIKKINHKHKCKKKIENEFIDDEAKVNSDASSDEDVELISDEDLPDFVSYTQNMEDQVDMQAHYLRTIKSPIKRPGAFYFKKSRTPDSDIEIYSQPLSQVQDSYLCDSFCVGEDAEPSILVHNESILERAEKELERNKRKRSVKDNSKSTSKRKKINILNNSVSSEDEVEQLRLQVQGE